MFFYTPLTATSSFTNTDEPVTFLRYDLNIILISLLNVDVDIQLILESKNMFGKYYLVFPKNLKNVRG